MADSIVWDDEVKWDEPVKPVNPGAWEQAGTRLGEVGRVFTKALASPAVLASKAAHKIADYAGYGDNVADLGPVLEEQLNKMAPAPTSWMGQVAEGVAESAPALALPGGWMSQVLGNAAVGAVQAERGRELKDAAIGGGLGAAGKVLTKALTRPVTPTQGAEFLMEQGINPTVGQGAASPIARGVEDLARGMPLVGDFIDANRANVLQKYANLKEVRNTAWNKAVNELPMYKITPNDGIAIRQIYADLSNEAGKAFRKLLTSRFDEGHLSGKDLQYLQHNVGKLIDEFPDDATALKQAKDGFHKLITDRSPEAAKLHETFDKFKSFKGEITPESVIPDTPIISGMNRLTSLGIPAALHAVGGFPASATALATSVATAIASNPTLSRILLGGTNAQQVAAELLRKGGTAAPALAMRPKKEEPQTLNDYYRR